MVIVSKKRKKNIKSKKINKKDYAKLIISFVLLVLAIYLFIYIFNGKYTISFDSDGGSNFSNLIVKKIQNISIEIPENYEDILIAYYGEKRTKECWERWRSSL